MSDTPTVVILAGGENSRFFPLNTGTHKGGRSIAGVTLIERCVADFRAQGFENIVIVVSPKDFDGNGLSGTIADVAFVLQPEPLGQADAILKGAAKADGDCIVTSPYYLEAGVLAKQLVEKKTQTGADCVLLASETDEPALYGMLQLEGDKLISITEKSESAKSGLKANSYYLLSRAFIESLKQTTLDHYGLEDELNAYAKEHHIAVVTAQQPPLSLKFSWQLLDFMQLLLVAQQSNRHPSAHVAQTAVIDESAGPVVIAAGASIRDYAIVAGPCYIGENVLIGEHSFIRGSAIESYAKVGARTEIARSLIMTGATIHAGYCSDSILGERTTVGAGLITANLRLDHAPVTATILDKKRETHHKKLGLITGDDVNIGVRVTSMPGTLIGSGSTIFPSLTISHTISSETVQKT